MSTIEVADFLYEANLKFTRVTEYGTSLESLLSGKAAPPANGARIDVAFEGAASGPKLKGSISGIDYLRVRADGLFELHIHAELTVEHGQKIAIHASGVVVPRKEGGLADLRETLTLSTSSKDYAWVNTLHLWGSGIVDLAQQAIHVKVYSA